MKDFFKSILFYILFLICIVSFIVLLSKDIKIAKEERKKEIERFEELIRGERTKMDSLQITIDSLDAVLEKDKVEAIRIDTVRIIERDRIISLPLDSAVLFLKDKLEKYEEKFNTKSSS